ncbi:MAG: hypothetical protein KKA79_02605, partial [Nanoarchaeota archaeon]|nr:hypothetical protein [Nanoarchaeota archaeon]
KKLTKYNKSHTLCQDQDKIQLCNICQNKIQDRIYYIMEKLEGAERNNYQAKIKHLLQEKKLTTKQKLFLLKDE